MVKAFHTITLTTFCRRGEEDAAVIETKLRAFVPFELEKEKIRLEQQKTTGFNERAITIYCITLAKEVHITQFWKELMKRLKEEQKATLCRQLESRLDEELNFFIRFDKQAWSKEERLFMVDHGDCYHLKMKVAAYPHNREAATKVLQGLLS